MPEFLEWRHLPALRLWLAVVSESLALESP